MRTHQLSLEVDARLYGLLKQAAQANALSIEEECLRRLDGGERRSRYVLAVVADLRADEAQRLVNERRA